MNARTATDKLLLARLRWANRDRQWTQGEEVIHWQRNLGVGIVDRPSTRQHGDGSEFVLGAYVTWPDQDRPADTRSIELVRLDQLPETLRARLAGAPSDLGVAS